MKLYTEEQVLKAIRETRYYSDLIKPDNVILKELTPIKLPSDEEIEKLEKRYLATYGDKDNTAIGFKIGCEWMRDKILNQNK